MTARADSLEEKRWKESNEKSLKLNIDETNKRCGTSFPAKLDWSTIKFEEWQNKIGVSYQSIGNSIIELCKKDDGKDAVKKGIKSVVIKNDPTAPKIELKDGELDYYISLNGTKHGCCYGPDQRTAVAYLLQHL